VAPSSIGALPHEHAVATARRLLQMRTLAFGTVGTAALLGAVALWLAPLDGASTLLLEAWIMGSAAAAGWLALTLRPRRRSPAESGFAVNVVEEPRLHEWVVELSRHLGVSAPGAIRIAPSTGAWIDGLESDPTLVIGAGSLGWLTRAELQRTVGIELAMLRVREDETVLSALRLAESAPAGRLARSKAPAIGFAVRLLGRRLSACADELREACVAWSLSEAPDDMVLTDDDVKEARLVDEAWALLEERWLLPAERLGLALDSIAFAHRELLAACEENGLVERDHVRERGPAALSLISDPQGVDIELAGWAAARLASGGEGIVGWDEYAERVAVPTWRQTAADAVAALSKASGRTQPATVDALVKSLDSGLGVALGTSMVEARAKAVDPHGDPPEPTRDQVDTAIADAIAHSVCLALVDAGLATPTLDVLWGVGMADEDDNKLDVEANVRGFVSAGDVSGLSWYVRSVGLDTSRPLPLDGVTAASPLPQGTALVAWNGWRTHDLIVSEGVLLGFQHSLSTQLHGVLSRLTGSYEELEELDPDLLTELEHEDPAQRPHAHLVIELDSVRGAELHRAPRGSRWALHVKTGSEPVRLTGIGDGRLVTRLLEPHLGDRLLHTGLSLRPHRFAAMIGKVSWYTIWGGVLVLLSGAVGLVQLLQSSGQQTSGAQAVEVVVTFGVFGAALIAIGLVPYRVIARRGHAPGLR
jgi:hypothetical protein